MNPTIVNSKKGTSEGTGYQFERNYNSSRKLSYLQKSEIIKNTTAEYFDMSVDMIENRCRNRENIMLKQFAATFIFIHCPYMSYTAIGEALGNSKPYDHATIMNSLKRISELIETNSTFRRCFEELKPMIKDNLVKAENSIYDDNKYYTLDINDIKIFDIQKGKAIIFVGMDKDPTYEDIKMYCKNLKTRDVKDTGLIIIQKLTEANENSK